MRPCVTARVCRLVRIADMWLRPRTETLPSDSRWWEVNDDPKWSALVVALGIIGLFYVGMAVAGLVRGRSVAYLVLLLTFVILRSISLGTLEIPSLAIRWSAIRS
jgi:hypothetical protein